MSSIYFPDVPKLSPEQAIEISRLRTHLGVSIERGIQNFENHDYSSASYMLGYYLESAVIRFTEAGGEIDDELQGILIETEQVVKLSEERQALIDAKMLRDNVDRSVALDFLIREHGWGRSGGTGAAASKTSVTSTSSTDAATSTISEARTEFSEGIRQAVEKDQECIALTDPADKIMCFIETLQSYRSALVMFQSLPREKQLSYESYYDSYTKRIADIEQEIEKMSDSLISTKTSGSSGESASSAEPVTTTEFTRNQLDFNQLITNAIKKDEECMQLENPGEQLMCFIETLELYRSAFDKFSSLSSKERNIYTDHYDGWATRMVEVEARTVQMTDSITSSGASSSRFDQRMDVSAEVARERGMPFMREVPAGNISDEWELVEPSNEPFINSSGRLQIGGKNPYNYIYDIETGAKYKVTSNEGQEILQKYLEELKN